MPDQIQHRRTDPKCQEYRPPTSRLSRWWHDRQRGRSCVACSRVATITFGRPITPADIERVVGNPFREGSS